MTIIPEATSVTFLNQPRITEHEADKEFNERRKALPGNIKDFIAQHVLFRGKQTEVTFSHSGISSLVCVLDTGEEKLVLKVPLRPDYSKNEGMFLRAWEDVGVNVPHVIETGSIRNHSYTLMEYVDAFTVSKTYSIDELIEKKIYVQLGALLRSMHKATAEGYGDVIDGRPEYPDIKAWLEIDTLRQKFLYVQEKGLLNDEEHGSLELAHNIIFTKIGMNSESVYGHNDFHIGNIFATNPLTVFDPIPALNHPYMDLARSIILAVKMGLSDVSKQLVRGYFGKESHDQQLLQAALILNAYMKLRYWHLVGREEDIKKIKEYLTETAPLLTSN